MIKAVIFDFFGVLVTEGFRQFCDTYFPDNKEKRTQAVRFVTEHDSGILSGEKYVLQLAELAGVTPQVVQQHMSDNKPNNLLLHYIKDRLKPKYKIGVLSNSGDDYMSQIMDPADVKIFDDVVLSYRLGMVKPQPEIFELAVERLGVKPSECVFVDDSPSHCEGAKRVGMQTVWYEDFPGMRQKLEEILSSGSNY